MKVGRLVASLVFVGVLVVGSLAWFAAGLRPLLGLDLVGGVSVVLQGPPNTTKDVMSKALDKIRQRVDALGVAEPDISLVGNNTIQVQLPGLGGQGKVVKRGALWCAVSSSGKELACFKARPDAEARAKAVSVQAVLNIIGKTARLEERQVQQIVAPNGKDSTGKAYKDLALSPCVLHPDVPCPEKASIWTYVDTNNNGRFDTGVESLYQVGPVVITGANLKSASAIYVSPGTQSTQPVTPGWQIQFSLDKEGTSAFSTTTTKLAGLPTGNPQKQLAILVDKVIVSSPEVQSAITGGNGVITGSFTEQQAKDLAVTLQSGALPVQLTQQTVETVSPTLGTESLKQGLVAGLVGLIALMLYLAFYYRLLGVVTWVGMGIWAVLALALVSILGQTVGYALTLAGIAGLIVSLGITADSYIVFYERLKDEVRNGKTMRAAVQPAFKRSWRTIVAADIVTATAAAVLYVVSIGSVRGFALTLGLSTLLDLFVVWFYKRPTVFLMARSTRLAEMRGFGLRSGVAADPVSDGRVAAPIAGGER
jgi:preprotein translocase subunit SecD